MRKALGSVWIATSRYCVILPQICGKTVVICKEAKLARCRFRAELRSSRVRICPKISPLARTRARMRQGRGKTALARENGCDYGGVVILFFSLVTLPSGAIVIVVSYFRSKYLIASGGAPVFV